MKRFTETEKWRDPWFQKLDRESRTLWLWLCDRVDNSGVVDICWPICNAETSSTFSEESMNAFEDRVERLDNGKWWIPKFTLFQFGELSDSPKNKVHQSVIKLLNKHSLSDRVSHRLYHTPKDKDKDKEKDKEKKDTPKTQEEIPNNLKTPLFELAWDKWKCFRIKKKLCKDFPAMWKEQLEMISEWGEPNAIEAIRNSIANDWQGLFKPKNDFNSNKHNEPKQIRRSLSEMETK